MENLPQENLKEKYGFEVTPDPHNKSAIRLQFNYDEAVVTIRTLLKDATGSDLVITNMTTLPNEKTGQGFGTQAIQKVIEFAKDNYMKEIRASQVKSHNDNFWLKNGFTLIEGENPTRDYQLKL